MRKKVFMRGKNFISIKDLNIAEIEEIFKLTRRFKYKGSPKLLSGKVLGLIFQKPSTRTRISFEVGMYELGGESIYLGPEDMKLGAREDIKDIAKVLSGYLDAVVVRTFAHDDILKIANFSSIPVINGLTDLLHPCQVLSDIYTLTEKVGDLTKTNISFIGDGNNVLHSLLYVAAKMGLKLKVATPCGYEPADEILNSALELSRTSRAEIILSNEPYAVAKGAEIIYTDVWTSMGQEKEYEKRLKDFRGFQVNSDLVACAKEGCLIMHCLPAHRGEEITDEVIDSPNSIVFEQAENRLYVQKAILALLLK